jgi:hypothetical protein
MVDSLASIVEPSRIADILVTLNPKVLRVHRQGLIHIPDLDEPTAIDIPIHDGNYCVGWNSNDTRMLVSGLNSHNRRVQFDKTLSHFEESFGAGSMRVSQTPL